MKRFNNSNITLLVLAFLLMMVLSTKRANADFFFGEPVKFNSHVSGYDELCCFSYDGLEMYISAMGGEGDYDLWVLKRASADEDWGPRENLGPAVNSPQGDYYASISADGLELYFASWREGTSSDWTNNDDLYVTKRPTKNDPWGQAMNLGPTVNRSGVQERSPWISLDGLELYFMSYRSGGYGGTDIWVTRRTTENDPWGEPANLGPIVNSSYYESYLSLSPDGLLLLFNESYTAGRPRRPGGYGASDMWMTRRTSLSDPWKEPINLGPKINSPSGDFLPRISLDGRMLYFCSERSGWEYWQAPIIPIVDFNGDGFVDVTDVSILTDHWGEEYPLCDIGPMPWGDGIVDTKDLKILTEYIEPISRNLTKTAYGPKPANDAEFVNLDTHLTWTQGFGAILHTVYFGEDFGTVNNANVGTSTISTNYNPGPLRLAKTYYWRIDEFDGSVTHKGDVWKFTTIGAVSSPNPADSDVDVESSIILSWDAGTVAASHEVYFGTTAEAVSKATKNSPEYKGTKDLGDESYDPGKLSLTTTYYWRIDEVNNTNPDSPWAGDVWSFTTGDFFVIDDFEDYDASENQIWYAWHDGLGFGSPGSEFYFAGNGSGAMVGDETTTSYTEESIVRGGRQSMPVVYDNNKHNCTKYSEADLILSTTRDWTAEGVGELSLWFRGYPASTSTFFEGPIGTYTMTASGTDIWNKADEFHYVFKMLTGGGSIVARVNSIQNTNEWAKAGVMIRETLDSDSKHAFACITPTNGVAAQGRYETGGDSFNTNQAGIAAPYWVKLERSISGSFTTYHSTNGTLWQVLGTQQNIQMSVNVYIGFAVTAHDAALTCQAVFSNVSTTGNITGQWTNQDIGIASNDAEPLYVAVSNSTGQSAVVIHDDPAAATIDTWTEWIIPLQAFVDQGISLENVDRIAIGLGTRGNMTIPGGSGKIYIDDIRLYQPREMAE